MKNVILIAAPAAGKGTEAEKVKKRTHSLCVLNGESE